MKEDNNNNGIFDMVDAAIDFYEDNEDKFRKFIGTNDTVKIDDKSPLKQAHVMDDKVNIAIETGSDGIGEIHLEETEKGLIMGVGNRKVQVEVPSDVDTSKADANLNNGVLDIVIPRTGGGE